MKKLLKQEWKYYLFFFLATVFCLIVRGIGIWTDIGDLVNGLENDEDTIGFYIERMFSLEIMADNVSTGLLKTVVWTVIIIVLIERGLIFWVEREDYGRVFFQSLPVRRVDRVRFHLIMDSLLIVASIVSYTVFLSINYIKMSGSMEMELPWLLRAICGEMVTSICYLLFLLGVIYFLEAFFVNGFIKIVGTVGTLWMSRYILARLLYRNPSSTLVQKLYGFFSMETVGNCYYSLEAKRAYKWNALEGWVHAPLQPELLYRGGEGSSDQWWGAASENFCLSRLYDFSHMSSYLGYVLAYLGLAVVFIGIAVWLSGKQELSRQVFYFSLGKYWFSAMISATLFTILIEGVSSFGQMCYILIVVILLFVLLLYMMSSNKGQYKKKKQIGDITVE